MKNLKRALSFALATVMLIGMMVVGASAAGFGDADEIVNTDAVNTMVALGIIKGKDDGNFDPTGIVTRAEMAKMICVALNGGKDPNLAGGGLYPDTKGHWASGYIDYCTNLGIVAGDTAGNFNPDKTVTGTEAAKMILIALGYNAENEKFVNDANWALNINIIANAKGLYEDLAILPEAGLSRDNAAQMLFSGMDATMVKYTYVLNTVNGNLVSIPMAEDKAGTPTILTEKFKLVKATGLMTKVAYDKDEAEYTYTVGGTNYTSANDYSDLFGMKAKVLYKVNAAGKTEVYGIIAEKSSVLVSAVGADIEKFTAKDVIKVDGKEYDLDASSALVLTKYNDYANKTTMTKAADIADELAFDLIDNTGDGKADIVVTYPVTVQKVTFVGKSYITAGAQYKYDECDIYEGVAKDDYVVITAKAYAPKGIVTIVKAGTVTGVVDGVNSDGEPLVDGTWYSLASSFRGTFTVGTEYKLVVVDGFVYSAKEVSATASLNDLVYVKGSETKTEYGSTSYTSKVYFMDGTTKVVDAKTAYAEGLYTYKIKSNKYELTKVDADNTAGFDGYDTVANFVEKTGKVGGTYFVADDATIIVVADSKVKFYTGADMKDWADYTASFEVLADDINGLSTIKMALVTGAAKQPVAEGTATYGYVISTPYTVKDGDDKFDKYTIWTTDGEITVLDKDNDLAIKKGDLITFKDLGNGKIENSEKVGTAAAVTGFDAKNVKLKVKDGTSNVYTLTKDTVYLYIDTENKAGIEGGELAIADEPNAAGEYTMNVWFVKNDKDELKLLVVDVNNDLGLKETAK